MPSSKQATKAKPYGHISSDPLLHQWILFIKYLLQESYLTSSSNSLEVSILPPNILQTNSISMIFPRIYKNGQMSKILPYPFEVDQSYPYNTPSSTYVITTNLLLNTYLLLQSFIPQFTTESQLLNKKPSPIKEPGW